MFIYASHDDICFFLGEGGGGEGGGISINVDSIVHAEMGVRCHFSREKLPPH